MAGGYRCKKCDLDFDSKKSYQAHVIFAHKSVSPSIKKILILGGGFSGLNVLEQIQKKFSPNEISITLVNEENYFLYTPMLPEVAAGMLHPSNICVPIRTICKNAKFYQATVSDIDLQQKLVTITRTFDGKVHALEYDYLVLALGSKNNFFGNRNMEDNSFTIKTIEDAISIRNHTINMLENAAQTGDPELQKKFLTFTVVGGGFAGVETIGELNHFVRQAAKYAYPSIDEDNISMNLISARDGILPELGKKLGQKAMTYFKKVGVTIYQKTKATDASEDSITLDNETEIPCTTIIWAGGVAIDSVITTLDCKHGRGGKICVDENLRLHCNSEVF
ncbi:MAG: FAD-dependent oxidoreductase, partial [Nitrosopumilaceae archaeon]|nr:FAD-dependent oxidoreductase [Nitrosopumilaceae archaeon]